MRVVGLIEAQEPKKTQGKPQENTPQVPDAKSASDKPSGK